MWHLSSLTVLVCIICDANARFIDLTYNLGPNTTYHPVHMPFNKTVAHYGPVKKASFCVWFNFQTSEHIGTHLDSPFHFDKNAWTVDQIPFTNLHGPAVVIDIKERVKNNSDAEVLVSDLLNWEQKYGQIPKGAVIIMNSGWGQYWGNQKQFLGTEDDTFKKLHFPGFSNDSAKWLLDNRDIIGIAVDTIQCDNGPSDSFPVHVMLLSRNIWCLENLAYADTLPPSGAELFALPLKIVGGSGSPSRVYAVIDETSTQSSSSNTKITSLLILIAILQYHFY